MSTIKLLFLKGRKSIVEKNGIKKPGEKPGLLYNHFNRFNQYFQLFFCSAPSFHHLPFLLYPKNSKHQFRPASE